MLYSYRKLAILRSWGIRILMSSNYHGGVFIGVIAWDKLVDCKEFQTLL